MIEQTEKHTLERILAEIKGVLFGNVKKSNTNVKRIARHFDNNNCSYIVLDSVTVEDFNKHTQQPFKTTFWSVQKQ